MTTGCTTNLRAPRKSASLTVALVAVLASWCSLGFPRPLAQAPTPETGEQQVVYGPKEFWRAKGAPVTETDTFTVAWPVEACLMIVQNGLTAAQAKSTGATAQHPASCGRVSSATVDLNGGRVVSQRDFNQKVTYLERPVDVLPNNKLDVTLASKPESCFTLTIICGDGNHPPQADAGYDLTAYVGDIVRLDGSASTDSDGDPLTFDWSFLSRPADSAALLADPTAPNPSFFVDRFGDYEIALTVSDGLADSAPDTVKVSTRNSVPVANAGPDQTAYVRGTVALDGSASTDVDGNPLTYLWSLIGLPAESLAVLSDPSAVQPTFVLDWPGTYLAQLIVSDGALDSAPDTVAITTENSRPIANAGPEQTAYVDDTVTVDGSGSSDADHDPLTFIWSLIVVPDGSGATLTAPATPIATFAIDLPGIYVAQLIVNDGILDSVPDTVTITTENSRPVADAGPDQTAFVGETVLLDGSGSSDADEDLLSYQWSLLAVPAGSDTTLDDADTETASFFPDRPGLYVAQLIVSDSALQSDPDTATVEVQVPNRAPNITSTPVTAATAGAPYRYDVEATDPDAGDTLTYSLTTAPPGMTIDPGTGLIGWTPTTEQIGDHAVTVRV